MEFRISTHSQTPPEQWNHWVSQIDESTTHHTWNIIHYFSLLDKNSLHDSFALLDNQGMPLAICPLGFYTDPTTKIRELSLGGSPLATPAIVSTRPSLRRKILASVFEVIRDYAAKHSAQRVRMIGLPLTLGFCNGTLAASQNSFELQKFQLLGDVKNNFIINLSLSTEKLLENVSPFQRKHIRKGAKQGIQVRVFSKTESPEKLDDYFRQFMHAHYLSAGRWTRPEYVWSELLKIAHRGGASLFVAFLGETPISFLFCCEFHTSCVGWQQVNLEEFEREYSPRHLLEWEAITYYQKQGFRYYDLGERLYYPQWMHNPSAKEITIGDFKERYGGFLLPKINWVGYLDQALLKSELTPYRIAVESSSLTLGKPNDEVSSDG